MIAKENRAEKVIETEGPAGNEGPASVSVFLKLVSALAATDVRQVKGNSIYKGPGAEAQDRE